MSDKMLANSSPYFTALQYINNLELRGQIKGGLISRFLNFLKNLSSGLKIIRYFVKVDRNVYITANKSALIHTNQILLSSNRLEVSP